MEPRLLFITRKVQGRGGMQQYTADLWQALRAKYQDRAVRVYPQPYVPLPIFVFQVISKGVEQAYKGAHIHLGDALLAPLGVLIKLLCPDATVSVTAHGLDIIYPNSLYQFCLRGSLPRLDTVVCNSQATAQTVSDIGIKPERITVIPCGIWPVSTQLGSASLDDNVPVLLSVGRLIPRKGVAWFISEVLPLVYDRYPNLRYVVIGSGPEEGIIRKAIKQHNLSRCVLLLGQVGDNERDRYLEKADVFVLPNISMQGDMEGFGTVCIEASVRGVPVVAARIEGVVDAVRDGETGSLYTPGNKEECYQAVCAMLEQPLHPVSVAQTTLSHYNWEDLINRYHHDVFSAA